MVSKKQKQILFVLVWIDALMVAMTTILAITTYMEEIYNIAMLLVGGNLVLAIGVLIIFLIYLTWHLQFDN